MPSKQHAIVIGVGPGLGLALVEKCAREEMKVSAGARDRDRLRKLLDERGLKDVPALRCDVADQVSVDGTFKEAIAAGGAPDLVIFNASGYARGSILELNAGQLEAAWRVGCLGCLRCLGCQLGRTDREHRGGVTTKLAFTGNLRPGDPLNFKSGSRSTTAFGFCMSGLSTWRR